MSPLKSLSIRVKLALLAGIPVVGILVLSTLIVIESRERAATAEALGSIEDLAQLSTHMSGLLHELQNERARTALAVAKQQPTDAELVAQRAQTDQALQQLNDFLARRDISRLPARLARDLTTARTSLERLKEFRGRSADSAVELDAILEFFQKTNDPLVQATAALTQLSDDGELLRSISSLVAVLEVKERASREHAVLAFVFARGEFPPGSYKTLVTLLTEADDHEAVFRSYATDEQLSRYQGAVQGAAVEQAAAMRQTALETTEDTLQVDPQQWFAAQSQKLGALRGVEVDLSRRVTAAAARKLAETQSSIRLSMGLAGGSGLISLLLALVIVRGVTRSVTRLGRAAEEVREKKDYSVRAKKTSNDELGMLTDAFNHMLSGIQDRDKELEQHRNNLEQLVAERTAALGKRNREMRLVLDNVRQGLVMIQRDGKVAGERSAAFDRWFGAPPAEISFSSHVARSDPSLQLQMQLAWDQLIENVMPLELSLAQMPNRMQVDGTTYSFAYTPLMEGDEVDGALLMISDTTAEVAAERAEAEQREFARVFERAIRDKTGFFEFLSEVGAIMNRLSGGRFTGTPELLRAVHTVKGNCSLFGVESVANVAHELESHVLEHAEEPTSDDLKRLPEAWSRFTERLSALMEMQPRDRVEVAHSDIDDLIHSAASGASHERLAEQLEQLKHEAASTRFQRFKRQIRGLAQRLGKPTPTVVTDSGRVRLPVERWAPFWSAFVHVVRNAVDHGLETAEERTRAGKPKNGKVTLRAREDAGMVTISVTDDGRGIDWEAVRVRAKAAGVPFATQSALVDALFTEGLTTADDVSSISGRGVGLSAVSYACRRLGGSIEVQSDLGQGTTMTFRFRSKSSASTPAASS